MLMNPCCCTNVAITVVDRRGGFCPFGHVAIYDSGGAFVVEGDVEPDGRFRFFLPLPATNVRAVVTSVPRCDAADSGYTLDFNAGTWTRTFKITSTGIHPILNFYPIRPAAGYGTTPSIPYPQVATVLVEDSAYGGPRTATHDDATESWRTAAGETVAYPGAGICAARPAAPWAWQTLDSSDGVSPVGLTVRTFYRGVGGCPGPPGAPAGTFNGPDPTPTASFSAWHPTAGGSLDFTVARPPSGGYPAGTTFRVHE